MKCGFVPFSMGTLYLDCQYGEITNIATNGIGINSYNSTHRDACVKNDAVFGNGRCSSNEFIDTVKLTDYFNKECKGHTNCAIPLRD